MPKAKPDTVFVHRIELQEKEREMLETAVAAKAVSNLAMPVVAGAGVYAGYKVGKAAFGWAEDIYDGLRERTREQMDSIKAGDGTAHTNIFGLPGWGIIPGIL